MSDTASIRIPSTGSIRTASTRTGSIRTGSTRTGSIRTGSIRRDRVSAVLAPRAPRQAHPAGTYVVADAEYAARTPGTFTGVVTSAHADGTFTSTDASFATRGAGSYID